MSGLRIFLVLPFSDGLQGCLKANCIRCRHYTTVAEKSIVSVLSKPEGRLKAAKTGFQTAFRLLRPAGFVFQTDTPSEQGLDFGLMADADDEGVG